MTCEFCDYRMPLHDEYGEYELQCVKLLPLPATNLTTGEQEKTADDPYYALFIYEDGERGEKGSFPIKFCPWCGRKLKGERNEQT